MKLRHAKPSPEIVIVAVDQPSLARDGDWPWPRKALADLITGIGRDHPRGVGWIFVFASPSNVAGGDEALHAAMLRTPTYVLFNVLTPYGVRAKPPNLLATSAAAGAGNGDAQGDSDGIVRRATLFEGLRNDLKPSMALLLAHRMGRGPPRPFGAVRPIDASDLAFRAGQFLIPYVGPPGSFTTVSASSVLHGETPPGTFADKLVLVGATAPNLLDDYPTPVSSTTGMPNVEVQANILNALLRGQAITPASSTAVLLVSMVMIWLMLTALLRLPPTGNLWLFVATSGLPLLCAVEGVVALRLWMPPASFLVTQAIIVPYWGWRRLNATSAYLDEELRELERSVGEAVLGGARSTARVGGDRVLRQMTLLQEAKTRVSDLRRFVADVLANYPDPVLVVDRSGRILTVNQAASDLAAHMGLEAAPEAAVGPLLANLALLDRQAGPVWPPTDNPPTPRLGTGLAPLTGVDPAGRAYEVRFTSTRSAGDEPTGWIIHLADVTALVAAMQQREDALQLLSHDMRSPQSAILATLSHPDFQGAPPTLRRRIEAHARRTLELADSFVRLARAESATYALEPVDMAHLTQDASEAVWALAQAAGVAIALELGPEDAFLVMADRSLLTRALINLLDNAVKFSPCGERVTCRLAGATLGGAPAVACQIIDHAGGLDDGEVGALFRRFGASRGTPRGLAGVGLGLAMVHTVVTRHCGEIVCDSVKGEGTVFTVTLPLHVETHAAPDRELHAVS